jgi:hypothetical protein
MKPVAATIEKNPVAVPLRLAKLPDPSNGAIPNWIRH